MSSPVTLSGFNNIDFGTIINALMTQASVPLTNLQTQQSNLQTQQSNFNYLVSRASTLQSAADSLVSAATSSLIGATSSDSSTVAVSAANNAQVGHYDVVVNDIARAQVSASTTTVADANTTVVAKSGTLTIGGKDVTINGNVTLQGLADAINGTDGVGVYASVVQTGATEFRMVLTSTATGKSGAFAIDGSKMVDGDSASVHFGSTNAVDASDADVLVNNVEIKSSSNTLDGLVPGLTLTVYKKTAPDSSVSVDLAPDVTNLKSQVNAFITSYNSLHAFSASMVSAATNGDPTSIAHDPMFRSVMQAVRGSLNGSYGTGTFNYLAQVGVEFQTDGTLKMNDAVWNDAVSQDPQGVAALIGGDGHSGAIAQFSSTLKAYTDSNGLFTTETTQFTTELSNLAQQISDMTDRLNQQRTQMQAEFTAADQAMTDLKTQSGALASFGSTVNSSISSSTSNLSTSTL